MTQVAERERIKARIRLLVARTVENGCTEAEALAAAEMVGRLLHQFALTMDEVTLRESACVQRRIAWPTTRRRPVDGCVPALARFCDCKVWIDRQQGAAAYIFFGMAEDVELVAYLYEIILRGIQGATEDFRAARPELKGGALVSAQRRYQTGMAARLAERLEALRQMRHTEFRQQHARGGALILVKDQAVEAAFRATAVRLVSTRRGMVRADDAYHQGYAAGEGINLNRPLRRQDRDRIR